MYLPSGLTLFSIFALYFVCGLLVWGLLFMLGLGEWGLWWPKAYVELFFPTENFQAHTRMRTIGVQSNAYEHFYQHICANMCRPLAVWRRDVCSAFVLLVSCHMHARLCARVCVCG